MPTIRAVPNPVMRDAYLQHIHHVSGVEEWWSSRSFTDGCARRVRGGRITATWSARPMLPTDRTRESRRRGGTRPPRRSPRSRPRADDWADEPPSTLAERSRYVLERARTHHARCASDVGSTAGLDDGTRADRPGDPRRSRRPISRSSRRSGSCTPLIGACSSWSGRSSTSGPTGRWRTPRRGIARRRGSWSAACHPSTAEQRASEVGGQIDRTGHGVGPSMTTGGTGADPLDKQRRSGADASSPGACRRRRGETCDAAASSGGEGRPAEGRRRRRRRRGSRPRRDRRPGTAATSRPRSSARTARLLNNKLPLDAPAKLEPAEVEDDRRGARCDPPLT